MSASTAHRREQRATKEIMHEGGTMGSRDDEADRVVAVAGREARVDSTSLVSPTLLQLGRATRSAAGLDNEALSTRSAHGIPARTSSAVLRRHWFLPSTQLESCRMNNFSAQPPTARHGTGLKGAKRDFVLDWRHWSAMERSVALAVAAAVVAAPVFASALLYGGP